MNMFKARKPRTLFEYFVAEAGVRKGVRLAAFVIGVSVMLEQDGPWQRGVRGGKHTVEQYAEWSTYSIAQVYKWQADYRAIVPEKFADVVVLIDALNVERKAQRQQSIQGVDAVAVLAT